MINSLKSKFNIDIDSHIEKKKTHFYFYNNISLTKFIMCEMENFEFRPKTTTLYNRI